MPAPATQALLSKPARKMINSLMNGANGGKPISASVPARKSAPVHGAARSKPRTSRISVVWYFNKIFPDKIKSNDFASA